MLGAGPVPPEQLAERPAVVDGERRGLTARGAMEGVGAEGPAQAARLALKDMSSSAPALWAAQLDRTGRDAAEGSQVACSAGVC